MYRGWLIYLLLLLSAGSLHAQFVVLEGRVRDANTHRAITGVNVYIEALGIGTASKSSGRFSLKVLDPEPDMRVSFQHVSYDTLELTIEEALSQRDFFMQERVVSIPPIDIQAGVATLSEDDRLAVAISIIDARNFELRGYVDAGDLLRTDHSIQIDEELSGKKTVSIRGGSPDEVVVLYNGFKLNRSFDNVFDLSLIDLFDVEKLEVIKGSSTSLYGPEAFSGVVNIKPRSEPDYSIRLQQRIGSYDSGNWGLQLHRSFRKLSAAYSQKRGGERRSYVGEDTGNRLLENKSVYHTANLGYQFGKETSALQLAWLHAKVDFQNERDKEALENTNEMWTARFTGNVGLWKNMELSAAHQALDEVQFLRQNPVGLVADSSSFLDRALRNRSWLFNANRPISLAPFSVLLGYQFRRETLHLNDEELTLNTLGTLQPLEMRRTNHGFSSIIKLAVATGSPVLNRANIDLSLRYDSVSDKFLESGQKIPDARISGQWQDAMAKFSTNLGGNTGKLEFNSFLNFGRSVKFPSLQQQISSANTFQVEENSNRLQAEKNDALEAGFDITGAVDESQNLYGWKISGNFFRNIYRNKLRSFYSPGTPVSIYENAGQADMTGFETTQALFLFRKKMTLELGASRYFFSDLKNFPFKHESKVTFDMYLDQAGYSLQLHLFREGEQIGLLRNVEEALKIPPYTNLDLHFSKSYEVRRRTKLIFNLSARNLLDDEFNLDGLALRDRRYYFTFGLQY